MPKVTRPTADPKNPHVKDIPEEKLEKFLEGGWSIAPEPEPEDDEDDEDDLDLDES
jgi:hypothetical protein